MYFQKTIHVDTFFWFHMYFLVMNVGLIIKSHIISFLWCRYLAYLSGQDAIRCPRSFGSFSSYTSRFNNTLILIQILEFAFSVFYMLSYYLA